MNPEGSGKARSDLGSLRMGTISMNGGVSGKVIMVFVVSMVLVSFGMILCHLYAMQGVASTRVGEGVNGVAEPVYADSTPSSGRARPECQTETGGVLVGMLVWAGVLLSGGVVVIRHLHRRPLGAERQDTDAQVADLSRAIAELEEMNRELTDFARIVSHDLKAPLRGIRSIAQWMVEDWDDKLNDEDKVQIDHLTRKVGRMQNLIDGILAYSKVGHGVQEWEPVDPNALVPQVVDTLSPPKGISVRIAPAMPTLQFSEVQLTQILQNLISNAIKHMDKPEGLIDVQWRDTPGFWEFSVADNGPGIPEKYHDKIFEVFQMLSPQDEKESTGVGLAIVKKIVEAGGGQVWVESEEGTGSTFYFTLPKLNDREKGVPHEKHQISVVGRG